MERESGPPLRDMWHISRVLDPRRPEQGLSVTTTHTRQRKRRALGGLQANDEYLVAEIQDALLWTQMAGSRSAAMLFQRFEAASQPVPLTTAPPMIKALYSDLTHGLIRTAEVEITYSTRLSSAGPKPQPPLTGVAICFMSPSGQSPFLLLEGRPMRLFPSKPTIREGWRVTIGHLYSGDLMSVRNIGPVTSVPVVYQTVSRIHSDESGVPVEEGELFPLRDESG